MMLRFRLLFSVISRHGLWSEMFGVLILSLLPPLAVLLAMIKIK